MNKKAIMQQIQAALDALTMAKKLLCADEVKETANSTPAEAQRRFQKGCCTYCDELLLVKDSKVVHIRGAHPKCHKKINRLMVEGSLTEESAVARGWLLPGKPGGRPPSPNSPAFILMQEQLAASKRKK